jgi:GLPGLI family protein
MIFGASKIDQMKTIFTVLVMVLALPIGAQEFQGKAIYQSKTSVDIKIENGSISEDQKEQIMESMKKSMEKTYELSFDRSSSLYREEERLGTPGASPGGVFTMITSSSQGEYYKNVQSKTFVHQTDMFGKPFLIKDSLRTWEWKLSSETKKIGNYTCYKATAIRKPNKIFSNKEKNESKQDSVPQEQDSTQGRSLLSKIEKPEDRIITVWYTPEIPISQGPGPYWGLPGLILEVNTGRTAILCSKLILNPEKKEVVEEPSKGKRVTQAEYDEIMAKKMEEMEERWKANSNRRGGNTFSIKIQG